jgi:hypothetical protein
MNRTLNRNNSSNISFNQFISRIENEDDEFLTFKELVLNNVEDIKSYMRWDNYSLNETEIPVVDLVKDHALIVLMNSYGSFMVDKDILNNVCADVFIYFPILLQQLSITRLIDAYGVVTDDIDTVETVRTETQNTNIEQNSELTQGTSQTDTNTLNTQQKTTGTVSNIGNGTNNQTSTTNIENSSGVETTGTRNVNINHNMPEQSIDQITENFPVDNQGTPILRTSFVQQAQEGFTTSNPINSTELSEQNITNSSNTTNDNLTTNDVTVADSGNTTRLTQNSGSDTSEAKTSTIGNNSFNELVTSKMTNKQYAYEIKAFLETADALIAFRKWEDHFTWVVGII